MDFEQDEVDKNIASRNGRPNTVNPTSENEQLFNHLSYLQELNESIHEFKQVDEEGPGEYNISGLDE
jgi:hypothetical protein